MYVAPRYNIELFYYKYFYRKRAGNRVLRLDRNGSEIGLSSAFRMRFDGCSEFTIERVSLISRTFIVSISSIESFEFIAIRLRDACVRGLFFGLFDLSISSDLFLNFSRF